MKKKSTPEESEFYTRYRGSFSGILKWPQLDEFWQVLRTKADAGWYLYAIGESLPDQPVAAEVLTTFIDEINKLLKKEHKEEYCGVVYVDNKTNPEFIKIYDPNNLGVVCGFSDNPPLPGWLLTLVKPEPLDENTFSTHSRKRWWRHIFSSP